MDPDKRELVQRLFVLASEIIEDAHEITLTGQSAGSFAQRYVQTAARLRARALSLVAIGDTVLAVFAQTDCE
jgi:hypothetical protein